MEGYRRLEELSVIDGGDPLADVVSLWLVQTVIILSICRILGVLGTYIKQPKVIFEIIGE